MLERYRLGYTPILDGATPDAQGSRAYVRAHDPLQWRIEAEGAAAMVHLGVDPGRFFCGGMTLWLARLAERQPGLLTGFIHVPPDQVSCPANPHLPTRAQHQALLRQVLAVLGGRRVLLTGFGAFKGAPDNPTQAFVEAVGGGVLHLAPSPEEAIAGRYYGRFGPVAAQAEGLLSPLPEAVIGLGVDSQQNLLGPGELPMFKIETQSWGFSYQGAPDGVETAVGHTALAELFLKR